jgi:hypothetical protein
VEDTPPRLRGADTTRSPGQRPPPSPDVPPVVGRVQLKAATFSCDIAHLTARGFRALPCDSKEAFAVHRRDWILPSRPIQPIPQLRFSPSSRRRSRWSVATVCLPVELATVTAYRASASSMSMVRLCAGRCARRRAGCSSAGNQRGARRLLGRLLAPTFGERDHPSTTRARLPIPLVTVHPLISRLLAPRFRSRQTGAELRRRIGLRVAAGKPAAPAEAARQRPDHGRRRDHIRLRPGPSGTDPASAMGQDGRRGGIATLAEPGPRGGGIGDGEAVSFAIGASRPPGFTEGPRPRLGRYVDERPVLQRCLQHTQCIMDS